ncbi:MAG: hypothetical protein IH949_09070, partial [Bacteroidetes bacterium]|nr:hypothetical protein [Bacteroidota bacterium]
VPAFINKLEKGEQSFPAQDKLRNKLASEWIDVTEFILSRIDYYRSK